MDASCYCGKHEREMRCGEGLRKATVIEGVERPAYFSCDEPCSRPFDCGKHTCRKICHPLEAEEPACPSAPSRISSCPCGAMAVTTRTSCSDPIPTCDAICSKPLAGCDHACPKKCHLGQCPPCTVSVSSPCRCGESKMTTTCAERQREEQEGNQEVLCSTVCKALRHCGKHQCGAVCCPLYFQAKSKSKRRPNQAELEQQDPAGFHTCHVQCGKRLQCGRHNCPLECHRGACPPCLQASFEDLVCHCGRTVLEPPVACGAQIVCNFPCTRPPPACGHPKVPHNCHEEEPCPPCVFLTDRICHCGKHVIKNTPCSRTRVGCGTQCGALLVSATRVARRAAVLARLRAHTDIVPGSFRG